MTDEKANATALPMGEPITGKDLDFFVRAFGARDPAPLLKAIPDEPGLVRFLPGVPPTEAEAREIAEEVAERLDVFERQEGDV